MARLSKRMKTNREKIEAGKSYNIDEALKLLKSMAKAKFDESVEVAVNLGIDPRKSDQVVRGSSVMPKGTGITSPACSARSATASSTVAGRW